MLKRILMIFTGVALCYSSLASAQGPANMISGYSTTSGSYKEYRISGYNIQPNRPGVWDDGCRTDNYYCMGRLERRRGREPFVEPNILQNHR